MSEQSNERDDDQSGAEQTGISDDQLPDDLVPGEENPLAEGLDDGETVGDLFEDGKPADQWDGERPDGADDEDESEGPASDDEE